MIRSGKTEAARPGAASKVENNEKFRDNHINSSNSSKSDSDFFGDIGLSKKKDPQHNAFQIIPARGAEKALIALKDNLKSLGCRYNRSAFNNGWICTLASRKPVEDLLSEKIVNVTFKEIHDDYLEKTPNGRMAGDAWNQVDSLERKYKKSGDSILVDERALENEIAKRKLQESSPLVAEKRKSIETRKAQQAETYEEIGQLRNSALLLEENDIEKKSDEEKLPIGFFFDGNSLMYQSLAVGEGENAKPPLFVCSRLDIKAITRDSEGNNYGRLLEFTDPDKVHRQWAMPMELLAGDGANYRAELLSMGLSIGSSKGAKTLLSTYIQNSLPQARARCVNCTGWHDKCFVLPDKIFGDSGNEKVILQRGTPISNTYAQSGSLDDWREQVATLCSGNDRLIFAMSAAFASPLLHPLGMEGGGFHFYGETSTGKTTAVKLAASVWGGKDYMRTWRATVNGLEGIAAIHNDTLLCLDEIGQIEPHLVGEGIYLIANGASKARANQMGRARDKNSWRLIFLSTGEKSLGQHMTEGGKRVRGGQEVRFLEIPAESGRFGMFEELHGFDNGKKFSEVIVERCLKYYGAPGREFILCLVKSLSDMIVHWKKLLKQFVEENLPPDSDNQVGRALNRFGLVGVAGEIATEFNVTGFKKGACLRAAKNCFEAWIKSRGGVGSTDEREILSQLKRFFEHHGESRFSPWKANPKDPKTINRAGFRRTNRCGEVEFYVFPESFKSDVCNGYDSAQVAKIAIKRGLLKPSPNGETTCVARLPGIEKSSRCYLFTSRVLGSEE